MGTYTEVDDKNMDNTFSKRLEQARLKKHMSRQTLSELCGMSKNMVSIYENGESEPTGSVIKLLAENLGVSADYLLGIDEKIFDIPNILGKRVK